MGTAVATHHELWEIKGEKSWLHMHPGQLKAWDSKKRWILVLAGSQSGKALACDTLIPVPGGFKAMGELQPGDTVFNEQGQATTVTYVSPVYLGNQCYELTFDEGSKVVADAGHLWVTRSAVSTTEQIGKSLSSENRVALRDDCLGRSIVSCVPVPSVPVRCITVDSKSSQYLCTKSYIPTHNTSWGPLWLNREIIEKGPGDYLGVTATFPLLKLKMLPELQKCFETYLRIATYVASDHIFKSNEKVHGAEAWRIILGSASNAESLESATAKAAWCDEAGQKSFSLSAWEAVRRRLALNRGRALMTTTPYGLGWLKSEFYDKAIEGDPDIELIQFDSTLNPAFPKEEFEQRRAEMPLWKFNMFYRGMFERPVGLIYDAFDESICKIKRFPIPESWPCYVGHDFGGANPAALFFRVDPTTGYIYAWQEYRPREGRSIHQHVEQFKKITASVMVFKRAGGSHQEDEIRQGYTAHGWPISEPKFHGSASVEAGIAAVYALHKRNKLFIFDDLVNYLDEKSTYSRKLDANFIPTDEIDNKSDYHLLDSERSILSDFSPDTATGNRAKTKRSSFAF